MEDGDPGRLPPASSHCAIPGRGRTRDRRQFSSFLFSLYDLVFPLLVPTPVRSVKQKGGLVGNNSFLFVSVCGFPFRMTHMA